MDTFTESYARYATLMALTVRARGEAYRTVSQMARILGEMFPSSGERPADVEEYYFEQAGELLSSLSDPSVKRNLSDAIRVAGEFSTPLLQEFVEQFVPELMKLEGAPSTPLEASASSSQLPPPPAGNTTPQAPSAKRRRRGTATSGSSEMPGIVATTPSTFPLAPASLLATPSMEAGPSGSSTGRISRSASRGSGRLSTSTSQTDLKRKRTGKGK